MTLTSVSSSDENEIDLDFILHTNDSTSDEQLSSTNDRDNIGLTADDMAVIHDSEVALPNGIFEDDGDGFGDGNNSTESNSAQHLSYSERLEEQKRQVQKLIGTEVKIEYGRKKQIRDSVQWTVVDDLQQFQDSEFKREHETVGIRGYDWSKKNIFLSLFLHL